MGNNSDHDLKPMPLEGIKVLECGVFHAGPGAGAILGDLGAEVIKIESGFGDPIRKMTNIGGSMIVMPDGESAMWHVSNRNKKGLCLDMKQRKGKEVFHKLVKDSDILIANLKKSVLTKLGLDYDTLSKINPRIICAHVSGYGPKGPDSDAGGFDPVGQARSGLTYITNKDADPLLMHFATLDQATAISLSHAILTALFVRERTGLGQEVHVSLYSTGIWLLYNNFVLQGLISVDPSVPWSHTNDTPLRNSFCCKDGKWIIGVHEPQEKYWVPFCRAIEREELIDDPRFADPDTRKDNYGALIAICDRTLALKTREEWLEIFRDHGLIYNAVNHLADVMVDQQALENGYIVDFEYSGIGKIKIPGYPIHFSANSAGTKSAAPSLGEHTEEILLEHGYSKSEIEQLREEGIIR
jgi:crotonobetainyl-CoA:carnitine CoA-transferase CaiB-like acyl-CoA transferase